MSTAASNIAVKVLAQATQHTIINNPAPGSMEATAAATGKRICVQCNALIRLDAKFCQNCGAPASAQSTSTPTAP